MISVHVNVKDDDLIDDISNSLSNEEIVTFIIALEKNYQDWSITEKLAKYFISQMVILEKEDPEFNLKEFIEEIIRG